MKKFFLCVGLAMCGTYVYSQQEGHVGINTLSPHPQSILDMSAQDKGVLVPRMTSIERVAINPDGFANGLLVYDINTNSFWYWASTAWVELSPGSMGPTGPTGADGSPGPSGSIGPTGPTGGDGPRPCPTGFVSVNDEYCIEIDEHVNQNWAYAIEYCVWATDARLCTTGEWRVACNHSAELGLLNMANSNWEWTDDGNGDDNNNMTIIGRNYCSELSDNSVNESNGYAFRCCKSR